MPTTFDIELEGPKGEPVDLIRTIASHGVADLPPGHIDEEARTYTSTLVLPTAQPRTVLIREGRPGFARVQVAGRQLGATATRDITHAVRQMLNLHDDVSEFYAVVTTARALSGGPGGPGWMLRTGT